MITTALVGAIGFFSGWYAGDDVAVWAKEAFEAALKMGGM